MLTEGINDDIKHRNNFSGDVEANIIAGMFVVLEYSTGGRFTCIRRNYRKNCCVLDKEQTSECLIGDGVFVKVALIFSATS